jgi:hypothetical protein
LAWAARDPCRGAADRPNRRRDRGPAAPPAGRLGALVDLRGDGRATLFLTIADGQGRSQVVAVRRGR